MDSTSTTSSTTATNDGFNTLINHQVSCFRYLSPINLTLAVYIMIQNSMIIYDYSKDWKRLSSCLFILIAAVDIGSACSELARGSVALLCFRDEFMRMQPWIFVIYLSFGLFCNVTSIFFGMVLTVVKTINIINPFYRINGLALRTCLALFTLIGFAIFVVDTWLWISDDLWLNKPESCRIGSWKALFRIQYLGLSIIDKIYISAQLIPISLVFFEFSLPCLIVLVCMILQIIYIKKALRESVDPRQASANHVTLTIFLISLLYLLSVSAYSTFLFHEIISNFEISSIVYDGNKFPMMVAKYTLPLLNASLFPTILILRKPELRARYRGYVGTVLHAPVSIFYYIRHRGRGYTVI